MQNETGEIDPNDTLFQECTFQPVQFNTDYDFELQCVLIVIKNGITIGLKNCISVRVRGRCEMGLLTAVPNELNFSELEYNTTRTLCFGLFNYSLVDIHYKLLYTYQNEPLKDIEGDIKLHPVSGTICSGSHEQIMISITPHTPGNYELAIQYLVRINSRSDTLLLEQAPTKVCNVICMCVLPVLKVQNMCVFGCGQKYSLNISKPFLWKSMQINKLNTILESILPRERKTHSIKFVPMIINKGVIFIKLFVINSSRLLISWIFKWVYQCDCKPVIKKIGFSLQTEELDCVHQTLCTVHPKSGTLKPNEKAIICMKIYYTLIGKSEISWDLDIGHDRHIILNILIDCLSESEQQCDFLSTTHIKFGQIYFGNKEAIQKVGFIFIHFFKTCTKDE